MLSQHYANQAAALSSASVQWRMLQGNICALGIFWVLFVFAIGCHHNNVKPIYWQLYWLLYILVSDDFSIVVIKYPEKINLGEERVSWAYCP